ncbi:RNA ligase RtcB family protein [Brucella sp. NM4]|uniref:RNA ligase RtcB family protein n=1 Tax=Brucella/Ochrobactrum group TaxID=2826938 RepID=UPI0024BC94CA|nr:RNA ligase RtcB family protein [Brucella sp. NM4]WHS30095.1 RNA ligase RtcB family protein [Brucella sp. NM4]WHT44422.1 RNA ligase RtcB family protein [Ochrobactrum sp. SSR]
MGIQTGSFGSINAGGHSPATIRRYYSEQSWIEGEALRQLEEMSRLDGAKALAAFPDLHPGKYGATGVALLSHRLHPLLIGNDIGCGMALFALDLPLRKLSIDKAEQRLRELEHQKVSDPEDALSAHGLPHDFFAEALGTIGGGNHFCELQAVDQVSGSSSANLIDDQCLYLLVHSGSRGVGAALFAEFLATNEKPNVGIEIDDPFVTRWMAMHDRCVAWATLNRHLIAERAARALRADIRLVADVPHNLVRVRSEGIVHHKGAAAVESGDLVPIAGSRASLSYIVRAREEVHQSLGAVSHGAGRKYDRASMHGRVGTSRSHREQLARNDWGGRAICDDRSLLIEEAASAYKDCGQVVTDLEAHQLVERVATMRPLVTYEKAVNRPGYSRKNSDKRNKREMRNEKR